MVLQLKGSSAPGTCSVYSSVPTILRNFAFCMAYRASSSHVGRGGVVTVRVQTVGIDEVRVVHAQLSRLLVHLVRRRPPRCPEQASASATAAELALRTIKAYSNCSTVKTSPSFSQAPVSMVFAAFGETVTVVAQVHASRAPGWPS